MAVAGGVLGDQYIAGMEAFYRPVGYFDFGYSRQVYHVLHAGSIVVVIYRRGCILIDSGRSCRGGNLPEELSPRQPLTRF